MGVFVQVSQTVLEPTIDATRLGVLVFRGSVSSNTYTSIRFNQCLVLFCGSYPQVCAFTPSPLLGRDQGR